MSIIEIIIIVYLISFIIVLPLVALYDRYGPHL